MLRFHSSRAIFATAIASLLGIAATGSSAHATAIIGIEQVGTNVVATLSGSVNLAGLTDISSTTTAAGVVPNQGIIAFAGMTGQETVYSGATAPANFGTGGLTIASSESGSGAFGVDDGGRIYVPIGYTSGSALSATDTFNGATISSLGITPGTYTYTFGSGATADSVIVYAGVPVPSAVPEPATIAIASIGVPLLGVWVMKRRKANAAA